MLHWANVSVFIDPQCKEAQVRQRLKKKRILLPEEKRMMEEYLLDREAEVTSGDRYVHFMRVLFSGVHLTTTSYWLLMYYYCYYF